MAAKQKITGKMTFQEALTKHPESASVIMKHGLHCIGCHIAATETIEQGASAHGLSEKDIQKMIKEMNETAK